MSDVERDEDIDNNEPGDLSPEDEKLQEGFIVEYCGVFVNVYLIYREYGGPEEGGWWYNTGQVIRSRQYVCETRAEAAMAIEQAWCDQENVGRYPTSSVLCSGWYAVYIEDEPGADFPTHRPHYE